MNNRSSYIAETDECGTVIWLWELKKGARMARPVSDLSQLDQRLQDATIAGAPLNSVRDWLDRARHNAPAGAQRH